MSVASLFDRWFYLAIVTEVFMIAALVVRVLFPPAAPEVCFVGDSYGDTWRALQNDTHGPPGYQNQAKLPDANCDSGFRWKNIQKKP